MKLRLVYAIFFAALCAVVLSGNKNGRASTPPGFGNTGAPGDETLPNGTPVLCSSCHLASSITSATSVHVFDAGGDTVTQYQPGAQYTARVTVHTLTGNPQRFGFQMIALRNSDTTDLDGFSDINPNNYKVVTVSSTGRTYAEHANVSVSNMFNVTWTAPPAGTGSVTFYAAGNAVNNNGSNNGDGPSITSLNLTEAGGVSTQNPDAAQIGLRVWPNPAVSVVNMNFNLPRAGDYRLAAYDLSGRLVWESSQSLQAGDNALQIPAGNWAPGVWLLALSGEGISADVKIVKL